MSFIKLAYPVWRVERWWHIPVKKQKWKHLTCRLTRVQHQISQQLSSQYWPGSRTTRQCFLLLSRCWDQGKQMPFSFARWQRTLSLSSHSWRMPQLVELTSKCAFDTALHRSEAHRQKEHDFLNPCDCGSASRDSNPQLFPWSLHLMFHRSWICAIRCFKLTILDLIAWLLCYLHPNVVSEIILQAN